MMPSPRREMPRRSRKSAALSTNSPDWWAEEEAMTVRLRGKLRACQAARRAVTVDLPHWRQQLMMTRREGEARSRDWAESGEKPRRVAKARGSVETLRAGDSRSLLFAVIWINIGFWYRSTRHRQKNGGWKLWKVMIFKEIFSCQGV